MSIQDLTGMIVAAVASLSSLWAAREYRRRRSRGELRAGSALALLAPPCGLCALGVILLHESSLRIIVAVILAYWLVVPLIVESIQLARRRQ